MTKASREIVTVRVPAGGGLDAAAREAFKADTCVSGRPFGGPADLNAWYKVRGSVAASPGMVAYTLEKCDPPPQVAATVPTVPVPQMPPPTGGVTRAQFHAAGWTDAQLQTAGYVDVVVMMHRDFAPNAAPSVPTVADELRALRGEIVELRAAVQALRSELCAHGAPLVVRQ